MNQQRVLAQLNQFPLGSLAQGLARVTEQRYDCDTLELCAHCNSYHLKTDSCS